MFQPQNPLYTREHFNEVESYNNARLLAFDKNFGKLFPNKESARNVVDTYNFIYPVNVAGHVMYMTPQGTLLLPTHMKDLFRNNFSWVARERKKRIEYGYVHPNNFPSHALRTPDFDPSTGCYELDYYAPHNAFNPTTRRFNTAYPIGAFPVNHDVDVRYIMDFLKDLAGINAPFLMSWLNWKLNNPDKRSEVAILLHGEQGIGKSTFVNVILASLFGSNNIVSTQTLFTDSFNSYLEGKLFVCIEELYANNARLDFLKDLITSPTIQINEKYKPVHTSPNTVEVVINTNDLAALHFEGEEQRRFMVLRATRPSDPDIFKRLYNAPQKHWEQVAYNLSTIDHPDYKHFVQDALCLNSCNEREGNILDDIDLILEEHIPRIAKILRNPSDPYCTGLYRYVEGKGGKPDRVLVNINAVFYENLQQIDSLYDNKKPSMRRTAELVYRKAPRLRRDWCIDVLPEPETPREGFVEELDPNLPKESFPFTQSESVLKRRLAIAFTLYRERTNPPPSDPPPVSDPVPVTPSVLLYLDHDNYNPDPNGCLETLNPLLPNKDRRSEHCASLQRFMFEFDTLSLEEQRAIIEQNKAILKRVVFSGNKSYHCIVELSDPVPDIETYKKVWRLLKNRYFKDADPCTCDPCRLTRSPGKTRPSTGLPQTLVYEGSNYNLDFTTLIETIDAVSHTTDTTDTSDAPCVLEVADAIKNGSFWTDSERWDHHREEYIIPAYRVLRKQGHTKEAIQDMIKAGVNNPNATQRVKDARRDWLRKLSTRTFRNIDKEYDSKNKKLQKREIKGATNGR